MVVEGITYQASSWQAWRYKFQVFYSNVMTVLVSAYNLFSQCLLYKSIFLMLLLCRAVASKVLGISSWKFAEYVDYYKIELEECAIVLGFHRSGHVSLTSLPSTANNVDFLTSLITFQKSWNSLQNCSVDCKAHAV